ncbi:NHLP-related RiPP peptide [Dokdonella sp.]|uniref:NHLP-related RiPP peptide n=1 Tax=Dokdonella sp. TaxID=2291710 RepID=UPI003C4EEACB
MSDARLPKAQELSLMQKLSSDDAYRSRFEKSPTDALKEIGVSDADIAALDPANLKPGTLADKDKIAAAHKQLDVDAMGGHACMIFPLMRLNYGDKSD